MSQTENSKRSEMSGGDPSSITPSAPGNNGGKDKGRYRNLITFLVLVATIGAIAYFGG